MYEDELDKRDVALAPSRSEVMNCLGKDIYNKAVTCIKTAPGSFKTRMNFHYSLRSIGDNCLPFSCNQCGVVNIYYYERENCSENIVNKDNDSLKNGHEEVHENQGQKVNKFHLKEFFISMQGDDNGRVQFVNRNNLEFFIPEIYRSFEIDTKEGLLSIFSSIKGYYDDNIGKSFGSCHGLVRNSNSLLNHILETNGFLDDSIKDDSGKVTGYLSSIRTIGGVVDKLKKHSSNDGNRNYYEHAIYNMRKFDENSFRNLLKISHLDSKISKFINNIDFTKLINDLGFSRAYIILQEYPEICDNIFSGNLVDFNAINNLEEFREQRSLLLLFGNKIPEVFQDKRPLSLLMRYPKHVKWLLKKCSDLYDDFPIDLHNIDCICQDEELFLMIMSNDWCHNQVIKCFTNMVAESKTAHGYYDGVIRKVFDYIKPEIDNYAELKKRILNKDTLSTEIMVEILLENPVLLKDVSKNAEQFEYILKEWECCSLDTQIRFLDFVENDFEGEKHDVYVALVLNRRLFDCISDDPKLLNLLFDDSKMTEKFRRLYEIQGDDQPDVQRRRCLLLTLLRHKIGNNLGLRADLIRALALNNNVVEALFNNPDLLSVIFDNEFSLNQLANNIDLYSDENRDMLLDYLEMYFQGYHGPDTKLITIDDFNGVDVRDIFIPYIDKFSMSVGGITDPLQKLLLSKKTDIIKRFHDQYRHDARYLFEMRNGAYSSYSKPLDGQHQSSRNNFNRTKELSRLMSAVKFTGNQEPLLSRTRLYRGIRGYWTIDYMADLPLGTFNEKNLKCIKGKELFDRSFSSYTIDSTMAQRYAHIIEEPDSSIQCKQKVLLVVDIPAGLNPNMIAIANQNNEVVFNRYQKLKVCSVKYSNYVQINCVLEKNADGMDNIEEKVYDTPYFKQYQEEFEINLGKYLYNEEGGKKSGRVYKAVQEGLELFKNKYAKSSLQRQLLRKKFYSNSKYTKSYYSGNVTDFGGEDISDNELEAILMDAIPTKEQLQSNSTTIPGNIREKMAALAFALDTDESLRNTATVMMDAAVGRRQRDDNEQERLRRDFNYQDDMGLNRSERERRYQKHYQDLDENLKQSNKSPLTYGGMLFAPSYLGHEVSNFYGKRLVSGWSGTSMRLIRQYIRNITGNKEKVLNFRLALMAYMLPERHHSLYEIMVGSHNARIVGSENLSTADTMDKSIDPLGEKLVRNKVCKDKKFPYERAYQEYIRNHQH